VRIRQNEPVRRNNETRSRAALFRDFLLTTAKRHRKSKAAENLGTLFIHAGEAEIWHGDGTSIFCDGYVYYASAIIFNEFDEIWELSLRLLLCWGAAFCRLHRQCGGCERKGRAERSRQGGLREDLHCFNPL